MTMRNVHLEGELANRFGSTVRISAKTAQEAFKVLAANDPTFKKYLVECHEKNVGFTCEVENECLDEKECLLPLEEGDLYIAPVPAGSKSAVGKILAAIAVIAIVYFTGGFGAIETAFATGKMTVGAYAALGGISLALNLAMAGIQQMMMPDPSMDSSSPERSYLFNGNQRSIAEGDPVPLLYGELRVPGRPISFEILNENTYSGYGNMGHHDGYHSTVPQNGSEGEIYPQVP